MLKLKLLVLSAVLIIPTTAKAESVREAVNHTYEGQVLSLVDPERRTHPVMESRALEFYFPGARRSSNPVQFLERNHSAEVREFRTDKYVRFPSGETGWKRLPKKEWEERIIDCNYESMELVNMLLRYRLQKNNLHKVTGEKDPNLFTIEARATTFSGEADSALILRHFDRIEIAEAGLFRKPKLRCEEGTVNGVTMRCKDLIINFKRAKKTIEYSPAACEQKGMVVELPNGKRDFYPCRLIQRMQACGLDLAVNGGEKSLISIVEEIRNDEFKFLENAPIGFETPDLPPAGNDPAPQPDVEIDQPDGMSAR